jgi:hypothetical protein
MTSSSFGRSEIPAPPSPAFRCRCIVDVAGNGCVVQSSARIPDRAPCSCGNYHGSTANF